MFRTTLAACNLDDRPATETYPSPEVPEAAENFYSAAHLETQNACGPWRLLPPSPFLQDPILLICLWVHVSGGVLLWVALFIARFSGMGV